MNLVSLKKEMGVIVSDLPQAVGKLTDPSFSLEQHISLLTQAQALIRVGVVAPRYVSAQYINPWVVQSFRLLRSGKDKLEPFSRTKVVELPDAQPAEAQETIAESELANAADSGDAQDGRRKRRTTFTGSQPAPKKSRTVDSLGKE